MSGLPFASVVVCTHNRADTLTAAGAAMLAIDYPADRWELVIVDNASTDATPEAAKRILAALGRGLLVHEPRPVLSAARNRGVSAARGEIVAFLDDDAFVEPTWLRELAGALAAKDTLAAGGPVEPWFQGELPAWFGERYLPYLSAWDRGPRPRTLTYNDYPRGNNMAFRRDAFRRFGDFSEHLGRRRGSLLSCEETEFCLRLERGGCHIAYSPAARIRHLTVAARVTPGWLASRFHAQGRSEAILEWRHAGWLGLSRGWSRWRKIASSEINSGDFASVKEEAIFRRCARRAFLGYSYEVFAAPGAVPRYRPRDGASWQPPSQPGGLPDPFGRPSAG